ncbi:hypothetical protein GJV85_10090 [Sulfurimonas aquatica]|uniref:Uncharacterized protein n=1 Tax=Sulfurimonas aquatica TaxID=2672570 RepID=A0A975GDK0_9BACT|nr:hypothetical protein [Sulfurimonas aquatica]QSZ42443.1 hypothetical protein GJV85_10090 [Sulfurimonas aquatica]
MATINWDEYKEHKKYSTKDDNFDMLLEFIKSYYNMSSPNEIYKMLTDDSIAQMMLDKRSINDAETLENYLYKL